MFRARALGTHTYTHGVVLVLVVAVNMFRAN
jgi:hypothetical protein